MVTMLVEWPLRCLCSSRGMRDGRAGHGKAAADKAFLLTGEEQQKKKTFRFGMGAFPTWRAGHGWS